MKRVLLLFFVVSTFTFTNCSKDDNNVETKNSIIGKWYKYSTEEKGEIIIHKYGKCEKDYIEFSDNEVKEVSFSLQENCKGRIHKASYKIEGNKIFAKNENEEKPAILAYKINGNELVLFPEKYEGTKIVFKRS